VEKDLAGTSTAQDPECSCTDIAAETEAEKPVALALVVIEYQISALLFFPDTYIGLPVGTFCQVLTPSSVILEADLGPASVPADQRDPQIPRRRGHVAARVIAVPVATTSWTKARGDP
jgi:hypothetical protein